MSEPTPPTAPATRGSLPTLLAVIFVDLLGFSLILPLLPYYAETFGASPTQVGFLVASYALAQLVGAPILGAFSDRIGRRPILIISIVGTSLGFLIFGLAGSLFVLFLARILDGLTGGNVSVAQAYIADVSTPETRARNFGLMGAAYGVGFVIGPALGGFMSRWGYAFPAFVAAGMALLNAIAVYFVLPESLSEEHRGKVRPHPLSLRGTGMHHFFSRHRAAGLLRIRFVFALAFSTFQTVFSLWSQYRLGLTAEGTGYVLTYVGVTIVIIQGGIVGPVSRRFRESPLIVFCVVLMAVGLAAWGFSSGVPATLAALLPISFAGGVFGAVINSALSHAVPPTDVGSVLGVGTSLESITRVVGPSVGGFLLGAVGTWSPGAAGALVLVLLVPYAAVVLRRPAPPQTA
jgi:DHA1 family tetracycline resistance protein-like MFS transporter